MPPGNVPTALRLHQKLGPHCLREPHVALSTAPPQRLFVAMAYVTALCHLPRLPLQLLEQILGYCGPRELGCLEATCTYFVKGGITDKVAKAFLKDIPRAKGLKPDLK